MGGFSAKKGNRGSDVLCCFALGIILHWQHLSGLIPPTFGQGYVGVGEGGKAERRVGTGPGGEELRKDKDGGWMIGLCNKQMFVSQRRRVKPSSAERNVG